MRFQYYRRGFTMIELIFVIVIMGIVGGIALEAIRQYYEGIYRTQEYSKRVSQADHMLDQLSKYFENAISSSIVNLDKNNLTGCYGPPVFDPLNPDLSDYTVAFIGVDQDSMKGSGGNRPGWSEEGLLMNGNILNVSDANLTIADDIIMELFPNSDLVHSAIYDADSANVTACNRFRWSGSGKEGYHTLTSGFSETQYFLDPDNNATHGHQKYLLRTGYAFRVDDNGTFKMYTNFRPWMGERYAGTDTGVTAGSYVKANTLGENVAHFYVDYNAGDFMNNPGVSDRGLVWRLKVCMRGLDSNLSTSDTESQAICRERRVHVRY